MRGRFRVRKNAAIRKRLLLVSALLLGFAALFELYQVVIPFKSANPLWQEVTIGEPVIGAWRYGGQDAEGYLRFYDGSETVLLPPKSHTFDADGRFVVIESYTPSSLTYAKPYEALPMRWLALMAVALASVIGLMAVRLKKRGKRMKFARRSTARMAVPKTRISAGRRQKFRATRKWL